MRTVAAAGAVEWRPAANAVEIALVHRPRYDDWSLPKGKLEPGESTRAAAVREVAEETGFRVTLGRCLGRVRYPINRPEPATKVVEYYAARAWDGAFEPNDEVDELCWCAPADALKVLTYRHDKRIVATFLALPADLTTLLLVRHARAGRRDAWDGPDELRPLSKRGRRQVPPVRAMAAVHGADRVHSAPLVRCVDTVRPIAEDLGVPVVDEPLLSEKGYADAPHAAHRRLLEIAAAGGVPVVCSQGGVIPDLVSRMAGAAGLPPRRVVSRKASVWVLSFAPGKKAPRLVAADYAAKP